jgi:putative Ca2+/H+ antiporter (TMEM165/GDT1 family)
MEAAVFASSFVLIALAELGDKTQLLTMALATRYRLSTVLPGVVLATGLLMLLAVGVGQFVYYLIPVWLVKALAGMVFLGFGVWILKGDDDDDEGFKTGFSPFATVFLTFLLAELGDKTQLAVIPLAATTPNTPLVWAGATLGMISANGLGILFGNHLGGRVQEELIKKIAAVLFMLFGVFFLGNSLMQMI